MKIIIPNPCRRSLRILLGPLVVAAGLLAWSPAVGTETHHVARELSHEELQVFLPLVCVDAIESRDAWGGGYHCATVPQHSELLGAHDAAGNSAKPVLALTAVIYGGFTAAGVQEAYLTYHAEGEGHVNNEGGGVLLRRVKQQWRLVHWYPGAQLDQCVVIPARMDAIKKPTRMVCRGTSSGQGQETSDLVVAKISHDARRVIFSPILVAEDIQGALPEAPYDAAACVGKGKKSPIIFSVGAPEPEQSGDAFATVVIEYALPSAIRAACKARRFDLVQRRIGKARLVMAEAGVRIKLPKVFGSGFMSWAVGARFVANADVGHK